MSRSRLVVLLPLVTAAGCYNEAASQSTMPSQGFSGAQPQYVSGPPGGAMDPDYRDDAYAGTPAYEVPEAATAGPTAGNAAAPPPAAPVEAQAGPAAAEADSAGAVAGPVIDATPGTPDVAATPATPATPDEDDQDQQDQAANPDAGVPADATAGVTDGEIDTTLDGYGQWVETDDYGQVWRPDATVVGVDFTPYETGGSWEYTDAGWAFACDYSWGWLPFHYGRWAWFHDYWGWVPGHRWGPAWVEWRHGGGVVGWRPLGPRIRDHRQGGAWPVYHHGGGQLIRDHRHPEQHDAHWRFASVPDFGRPHIRSHLYGNLAEGLRVTGPVAAPPLRSRTTVHAGDLMRSRFATGARWRQPGVGWGVGRNVGPSLVRDHRSGPGQNIGPSQVRDHRWQPYAPSYNSPARTYQRPEAYRPPLRTQPYQPPVRTYQPPVRTYQPPVRTYQPPVRMYQPPGRTYQPPPVSAPRPTWSPPSRSWSPPPSSGSSHGSSSSGSHGSSSGWHGSSGGGGSHWGGGGHHR